jgi:hypothetical protein
MKGKDSTLRPPNLKAYTENLKIQKTKSKKKHEIIVISLGSFHPQGLRRLLLGLHSKLRSSVFSRSISTRIEFLWIISPQELSIIFVNVSEL